MTCAWVGPVSLRRCTIEVMHYHWPAWRNLAVQGDWPSRMMLLIWWPASRAKRAA
jgi:hypothetical protein